MLGLGRNFSNVLGLIGLITVVLGGGVLISNIENNSSRNANMRNMSYGRFVAAVQEKQISRVLISPDKGTAQIVESDGGRALVNFAPDQELLQLLTDNDVDIAVQPTCDSYCKKQNREQGKLYVGSGVGIYVVASLMSAVFAIERNTRKEI